MKPRRLRSDAELLRTVEQIFLREVLSFDGPKRVGVRLDGRSPDRSVFGVAVLESCASVVVARVCEADLDRDPERALHLVYMSGGDLELVQNVAMVCGPHG
jgi:hypothetical protein